MEFLNDPNTRSILAIGALMAAVALAIMLPAILTEVRRFFVTPKDESRMRLEARVGYLEGELGALALEIERIGESQRYLSRLMQENPSAHKLEA
jgi:hypothetical protein